VDARSDIFSLGAMLYWMTTGEKPFPGDTISAVAFKVVYEQVVPPRQIDPALSAELESTLVRSLAKNPDQRYPNAAELAKDLTALKTGSRRKAAVAPGVTARTMALPDLAPAVAAVKAKWNELFPGNWKFAPLGFVALLAVIVVVGLWLRSSSADLEASGHEPASAVATPTPAPAEAPPPEAAASQPAADTAAEKPVQKGTPSKAAAANAMEEEPPPVVEPPPQEPAAAEPPVPEAAQLEPTPAEAVPPPPPAKIQARAAMATLQIECKHNFKQAKLEVFSGGQKIYTGELAGQSRVLARASGVLNATAPIRAGEHTLSVRVTADREDYRGEITGTFTEGVTRTLHIGFGKGSGLGFKGRKLSLSWRE